ncbi:hypothetical protein ACA910_010235 [Epithemia clementina (nom. ined.)]
MVLFHNPPYGSSPVAQTCDSLLPVASIVETQTVATFQSPISYNQFEHICQENKCLVHEMADFRAQFHQLQNRDSALVAPNIDDHICLHFFAVIQAMQTGGTVPPPLHDSSSKASCCQGDLKNQEVHLLPNLVLDTTMAQKHSFNDGAS